MVMPTGVLPSYGDGDQLSNGLPAPEFGNAPPPLTHVGSLGELLVTSAENGVLHLALPYLLLSHQQGVRLTPISLYHPATAAFWYFKINLLKSAACSRGSANQPAQEGHLLSACSRLGWSLEDKCELTSLAFVNC